MTISGRVIDVEGPKGKDSYEHRPEVTVRVDEDAKEVIVERDNDERASREFHGLTRALIANMIEGVTKGYSRQLLIEGVGFRAQIQGKKMMLSLGFANAKEFAIPDDITVSEENGTRITVTGLDKQRVGQAAARIRSYYPVEPYKGKGIRYSDEVVRRKVGKTVA